MWTKSLAQTKSSPGVLKNALVESQKCEEALDVTPEEMHIQMDYFSRHFDRKYYDNAMKIWGELRKNGYKGK